MKRQTYGFSRLLTNLVVVAAMAATACTTSRAAGGPTAAERPKHRAHVEFSVGLSYAIREEYGKAIEHLKRAEEADPDSGYIKYHLAKSYFGSGQGDVAERKLKEALEASPDSFDIYSAAAQLYAETDKNELAIKACERALEIRPQWEEGYALLANLYVRSKDTDQAIAALSRLLQVTREPAAVRAELARLYLQVGKPAEALPHLLKLKELKPEYAEELDLSIGNCYEEMKDYPKAIESYKAYVKQHRDSSLGHASLVRAYQKAGMLQEGIEQYEAWRLESPGDRQVLFAIISLYWEGKQPERAIVAAEELVRREPQSAPGYEKLASLQAETGKKEQALRTLEAGIEANPGEISLYVAAAEQLEESKRYAAATEMLERASQLRFRNLYETYRIYLLLGMLYRTQRDYETSLASFSNISDAMDMLRMKPEDRTKGPFGAMSKFIEFQMAATYDLMKESEKAEAALKRALAIDENFAEANNYLAYFYAQRGINIDYGTELIQKALAAEPENGAYLDTLGWIQFKQGKPEIALETLRRASEQVEDPVVLDHLGDAYEALGDLTNAVAAWKESAAVSRKNAEAGEENPDPTYDAQAVLQKIERAERRLREKPGSGS